MKRRNYKLPFLQCFYQVGKNVYDCNKQINVNIFICIIQIYKQ